MLAIVLDLATVWAVTTYQAVIISKTSYGGYIVYRIVLCATILITKRRGTLQEIACIQ